VKRIYIAALLALSALVLNGFSAAADTPQVEAGFNFQVLADNTAQITGCTDTCSATDLVIPATLGGVAVSKIAASAFSTGTHNLQGSLTLPDSLVEVGNSAFANNSITAITFPANFAKVGTSAFSHNKLASLTIPTWMTSVPNSAFSENPLTSLVIPEGVKTISAKAFYNSTNGMTGLILPTTLTKLEDQSLGAKGPHSINMFFLGKAPSFPSKKERAFSDVNPMVQEVGYTIVFAYKHKASWLNYFRGKTSFQTITFAISPERYNVAPNKPTATWARLNIQAVYPDKETNAYVLQLSGSPDIQYEVTTKANVFNPESQFPYHESYTFTTPPPGFFKIDLKKDPERVLAGNSYSYYVFPESKSNWSYFESKPVKIIGDADAQQPLLTLPRPEGEHLIGNITLSERRKLKKYYCTWNKQNHQTLDCKTTPSKTSPSTGGGGAGGN